MPLKPVEKKGKAWVGRFVCVRLDISLFLLVLQNQNQNQNQASQSVIPLTLKSQAWARHHLQNLSLLSESQIHLSQLQMC